MQKRKDKWNDFFELGMFFLAAICFVYFLTQRIYPKVFEAVLIVAALVGIRVLIKIAKVELFPLLRFSILFFIFIAMFMANEFGFYGKIPYLDKMEHFFSGVILTFIGLLIFRKINKKEDNRLFHSALEIWFSLFFSVAMAGCWEIYEFVTDGIIGLNSQNGSIADTMFDMICGTLGAIMTCLYLGNKKGKRNSFSEEDHFSA